MSISKPIRMIIDCDPGHDDAVALLVAHTHADVVAITTVSGNAALAETTRNALAVVELLGADTPVHSGAAQPLVGKRLHATHVHGANGLAGANLPAPVARVAGTDAAGFLIKITRSQPDVWIVAIGPLTNIAAALQRDPTLSQRIAGISIMGGSASVGNATAVAEFNIWADPEAAEIVFGCGARLKMCGLNLTHQLRTSDADVTALRQLGGDRADFVADLLEFMHTRMADLVGVRESALHDPCAVLAVTHPHLLSFEQRSVAVELLGTHTRGMTVVDERTIRRSAQQQQSGNVEVAYQLHVAQAMQLVMETVAGK
jgi:inosine-uridine nucleoside N-ribohydrolase